MMILYRYVFVVRCHLSSIVIVIDGLPAQTVRSAPIQLCFSYNSATISAPIQLRINWIGNRFPKNDCSFQSKKNRFNWGPFQFRSFQLQKVFAIDSSARIGTETGFSSSVTGPNHTGPTAVHFRFRNSRIWNWSQIGATDFFETSLAPIWLQFGSGTKL